MNVQDCQVVVMTSDRHDWLLRGFFHQWDKYGAGLPVLVAGFTPPARLDSPLASFVSLGDFADYPATRWSDALLQLLARLRTRTVLLLLEDYWLIAPLDRDCLERAVGWMAHEPDVLRFCLTTDRIYAEVQRRLPPQPGWGVGLIESLPGSTYGISLQASLWDRANLQQFLRPGESPWQLEIEGTGRLDAGRPRPFRVVGTTGWAIPYQIMVSQGRFLRSGSWMLPSRQLSEADYQELEARGYTHAEHHAP